MVVFHEVCLGDDESITETAVLCSIFHFLGEYVTVVDDAIDVVDEDFTVRLGFSNLVLSEIDMFDAFVGKC